MYPLNCGVLLVNNFFCKGVCVVAQAIIKNGIKSNIIIDFLNIFSSLYIIKEIPCWVFQSLLSLNSILLNPFSAKVVSASKIVFDF